MESLGGFVVASALIIVLVEVSSYRDRNKYLKRLEEHAVCMAEHEHVMTEINLEARAIQAQRERWLEDLKMVRTSYSDDWK